MKVEIVSRKMIKPSTPTPTNLRNYKVSYLDDTTASNYFCVIFYYSFGITDERSKRFEESLAEILSRFYPLAGRYIEEKYIINCSDQGAQYMEAQVDCHLVELINGFGVKPYDMQGLFPREVATVHKVTVTDPLLRVQVSKFRCEGIAISVSVSHKVMDGASLGTFIAAWTSVNRLGDRVVTVCQPVFNSSLLFPCKNIIAPPVSKTKRETHCRASNPEIVIKRFLFDKEAMSSLRARATSSEESTLKRLSRVRLVSALIIKAFARISQKKYGNSRALLLSHQVNIRERTIPPLPKYSFGNLILRSLYECTTDQCQDMEFGDLVRFLGDGITKVVEDCAQILSDPEKNIQSLIKTISGMLARSQMNDANILRFTDWSKFKFYDADFGWGKPIWVSSQTPSLKNLFILMGDRGNDGIEAWVHLEEEEMTYFEDDEEIKLFTT